MNYLHIYLFFRTDKARRSYIGALCGLGFNPLTGESLYPDHDIEISFDIEINLEDIREASILYFKLSHYCHFTFY